MDCVLSGMHCQSRWGTRLVPGRVENATGTHRFRLFGLFRRITVCRVVPSRCVFSGLPASPYSNGLIQLPTVDPLARASMKTVAKRDRVL